LPYFAAPQRSKPCHHLGMPSALHNIPTAESCDVMVVGGGINGVGIARDLAGRGLSVVLCEKDGLAAHTSSASTKLIHGGLRYLEHFEFGLVRKALREREVLLRSAQHIMWPLRFVMPHDRSAAFSRPAWMLRLGLFLYDHLAPRELLPASTSVVLGSHPAGLALHPNFRTGFVYSDAWVDDARLVVLCAMDARERGAQVLVGWSCTQARREGGLWQVQLQATRPEAQALNAPARTITARALVNATGPWAAQFLGTSLAAPQPQSLRLIKGSHIVVPRCFDHDYAYIFQNPDRRIIFAIPYEDQFTLIGTTDVEHHGSIETACAGADEIAYLCAQANRYFRRAIAPTDVVWSYSGVRPLLDDAAGDAAAVTRDYVLELDMPAAPERCAPLLNVWGGKLTTFRKLAEEAVSLLAAPLGITAPSWTRAAYLPGGDWRAWLPPEQRSKPQFSDWLHVVAQRHPALSPALRLRVARAYGARLFDWLEAGTLGAEIAPELFEAELRYLCQHEWARSADDVLWRRTKLGLHYTAAQRAAVADWFAAHRA
jgi:glycerol-3-phosphate dehydrogenase